MNFSWSIFLDLGLICVALLIATFIRSKVRFFQKFLIPNALVAGFILLPFYNIVAHWLGMGREGLENLVFHLLNLSFVAMSLRGMGMKGAGRRIFSSAVTIIIQYTLQVIVGFGLTLIFIATFLPKLFPSFGFLMPLGYGLGPGQAFAIGKGWEVFGFEGGGNLGLVFAAIENGVYLSVYLDDPTPEVVRWRWVFGPLVHGSGSLLAGIGIARMWSEIHRTARRPRFTVAVPWFIAAMVVHGGYNAAVTVWKLTGGGF